MTLGPAGAGCHAKKQQKDEKLFKYPLKTYFVFLQSTPI
jgi:hypothetical protein